jgi:hypothetical protein
MQDANVWWDLGSRAVIALAPILVAVLGYVSMKAAELLQAKVKNEYLQGILVRLDDAVFTAVCEVQQVVVDKLKSESTDGHLDATGRAHVKAAALEAVRSYLGPKGLTQVGRVLGIPSAGVDRHLESRVEAAVFELRSQKPLVLNGHNPRVSEVAA